MLSLVAMGARSPTTRAHNPVYTHTAPRPSTSNNHHHIGILHLKPLTQPTAKAIPTPPPLRSPPFVNRLNSSMSMHPSVSSNPLPPSATATATTRNPVPETTTGKNLRRQHHQRHYESRATPGERAGVFIRAPEQNRDIPSTSTGNTSGNDGGDNHDHDYDHNINDINDINHSDGRCVRATTNEQEEREEEGEEERKAGEPHEGCFKREKESPCCWDSEALIQAYRSAAGVAVRRLSSALFGQELLAVEAARASAAERERMLEGRANALFESQVG